MVRWCHKCIDIYGLMIIKQETSFHFNGFKSTSTGGYSSYRFISLSIFSSCDRLFSLSLDAPSSGVKLHSVLFSFSLDVDFPLGFLPPNDLLLPFHFTFYNSNCLLLQLIDHFILIHCILFESKKLHLSSSVTVREL